MAPAAGSARSWAVLAALTLAAGAKTACTGDDTGESPIDEALAAMLADVGPEVVHPTLVEAAAAAAGLRTAAAAWAEAEATGDGEEARAAAQAAWWTAMEAWQAAEGLQIGPAASSLTAVAGADRRDAIYSWPTVNRCRVDQETVYGAWADPAFFDTALVNVIGLDALEVLLHAPVGENDCPAQVDINADGSWEALGADGVQERRAAYAAVLADRVADEVEALVEAWDPAGSDFGAQLALAGTADSVYESPQQALNAVFDALFYLELVTKDRKLGYALGVGECEGSTCIEDIESPLAGGSHAWVAVNLRAFRALFTGGEGTGMDELLASVGQASLAGEVIAALDAADQAAAAVEAPFDAADPAEVQALYDAVKAVTDLLKGDVATHLALQVPAEAAGDND